MTASLRIAVADDEPDMRDYFARILPLLGHRVVVVAADGEELVAGCQAERPDLVITDVKMPGLDGLSAATRLSAELRLPIILVSAHHELGAGSEGVLVSLVKPIRQAALVQAIAQAVGQGDQARL